MNKKLESLLYRFGTSLILVFIACFQIYNAQAHDLTPWKGGGFGMFSTVDSPGARFVRIYLITDGGEVPVEPPASMSRLVDKARAVPSQANVSRLVDQLRDATWVPYDYMSFEHTMDPIRQQSGKRNDLLDDTGGTSDVSVARTHLGFRVKYDDEPDPTVDDVVVYSGVRVELWRYWFNSGTGRIVAHKFREATSYHPDRVAMDQSEMHE